MNKEELEKKLIATFKIEALEHLQSIATGLLLLEKNTSEQESVKVFEVLHRETHSLKGAARAVDSLEIETICQAMEKVFSAWKRQELKPDPKQFDNLYQATNAIQHALSSERAEIHIDQAVMKEVVKKINNIFNKNNNVPEQKVVNEEMLVASALPDFATSLQTVRIASSKLDSILLKSEEMLTVKLIMQKCANEFNEINDAMHSWKKDWSKLIKRKSMPSPETIVATSFEQAKKFENAITQLKLQLDSYSRQVSSMIDGLLSDSKKLVMLPFSTLFDSFPMMVRNISREQGKQINLILEGTDIEIDKRILDELKDPIIHLLRNSIDHGIEKPEQRNGKPAEATIKIAVSKFSGTEIEITISDDGRGIDVEAVKKSAIKQGHLTLQEATQLNDSDALSLIYLSGVSTSPLITNVSGHGIGMAIVYEALEKMGGRIDIKSQINKGTDIKLSIPLSLTTFKGILIKSAQQQFVLPTANLERVIQINPEQIKTIENKETVVVDKISIPFAKLSDVLNLPDNTKEKPKSVTVAILSAGEHRVGFQIEEIIGEQQILVKKLTAPLLRVKCISAATILESGTPIPILNTSDLVKVVIKSSRHAAPRIVKEEPAVINKNIIVAEDSITTRTLLKNILEMAGYEVTTAVDGLEAWEFLQEKDIGLVISDVEMPRMDGFQLTRNIRKDKKLSEIPVILITTRDSREDREYGVEVGASAYIVKSHFDDNNLLAIIKRLL